MVLMTCPTCRITTIPPQLFRVTLLRRLRFPLHLTVRSCRCGLPLDEFGHHRAACAQAGVLSKRGWALENVVARICREAGGRVTTNGSGTLSSKLQKKTHPKTLSSKNTFVQNHFIQNRRQFHPRHFHPKTGSSSDTFIQKWFRPMTFSSKTGFIQ